MRPDGQKEDGWFYGLTLEAFVQKFVGPPERIRAEKEGEQRIVDKTRFHWNIGFKIGNVWLRLLFPAWQCTRWWAFGTQRINRKRDGKEVEFRHFSLRLHMTEKPIRAWWDPGKIWQLIKKRKRKNIFNVTWSHGKNGRRALAYILKFWDIFVTRKNCHCSTLCCWGSYCLRRFQEKWSKGQTIWKVNYSPILYLKHLSNKYLKGIRPFLVTVYVPSF